jgi:TRAP-type C4-dicarboxylate transport system substrate-binding protein
MKKACLIVMALCVVSAFVASAPEASAQTVKLKFSCQLPETHVVSKLSQAWCKEVEDRTKGRVKVQLYPGGTLTKPQDVYEGVVKGLSDLGQSLLSYSRDRFPVMSTTGLPLGFTSGRVATGVVNEVYRHFKPKELADTEVMYLHAHGPGFICTRGKAVARLEDMKGLKIRSQEDSRRIVEQLGGVYVFSVIPAVYGLLQEGKIAGATNPLAGLAKSGYRLGEVANHVTAAYSVAYTAPFFVVMNKEKWKALPEDVKTIIREINNEWIPQCGEAWDTMDSEGRRYFLDHGGQIVGLDKDEAARWKKAVEPIIEDYEKSLNDKGLKGQEIVKFTIDTLNSMQ